LHGIPIALKDLCQTRGVRTTAGSQILRDWAPEADAELVTRLRSAGAILIGKANLHEFAYGVTTANPHYGPTRNPWDRERVPGGSSGGSAAAVSAEMCLGAIGSDTGGSIRLPAAFCGIVGLKPTYGRVSRRGCIPLSWTLDHMGPMTRTVQDAALLLQAIAGHDPDDIGSSTAPVPDFAAALGPDLRGVKLARLRGYVEDVVDPEIDRAMTVAMSVYQSLGATVEDVTIPAMDEAPTLSVTIMATEATTYHLKDLQSRPEEYGADVRMRLKLGANILGIDYVEAQRMRAILTGEVSDVLKRFDAIITPTAPQPPMKIDEIPEVVGPGPATRYLLPFNVTGHPALAIPCGFTAAGLPIGLQLIGRHWEESTVLRIGHAYEQSAGWHERRPPLLDRA
jgi:aspartyl-tRNA(Asn)/glutamyl-tRNA(Gln) amidotransferase subunit A